MKRQIVKTFDKAIGHALALLGCIIGISGCRMEYGCPHADYEIKGTVTNAETKEPIEGIQVTARLYGSDGEFPVDTTDANGAYRCRFNDIFDEISCIKVNDIDGESNGGVFCEDSITDISYTQTKKGDHWYMGAFEATADFALKKQEETEQK